MTEREQIAELIVKIGVAVSDDTYEVNLEKLADTFLAYIQKRNVPSWEIIRSWMPANTENGIEIAKTIHDKLKKGKK
jgi:hypothetical protein